MCIKYLTGLFFLTLIGLSAKAQEVTMGRSAPALFLPNNSPDRPHKEVEYFDAEGERVATAAEAHHRREISYRDAKSAIVKEFYPSGKLMDFSAYASLPDRLRHGVHTLYYDNAQLAKSEVYAAGSLEGERLMYYPDGVLRRRDFFEKGVRKTGEYYTSDGKPAPYLEAEEMPIYETDGTLEIVTAVQRAVRYPKQAMVNGVQGKVYAAFNVTETGQVEDVRILVGAGLLDAAVIEAVKHLHHFAKPGKIEGKAVKVSFTVPVTFRTE